MCRMWSQISRVRCNAPNASSDEDGELRRQRNLFFEKYCSCFMYAPIQAVRYNAPYGLTLSMECFSTDALKKSVLLESPDRLIDAPFEIRR